VEAREHELAPHADTEIDQVHGATADDRGSRSVHEIGVWTAGGSKEDQGRSLSRVWRLTMDVLSEVARLPGHSSGWSKAAQHCGRARDHPAFERSPPCDGPHEFGEALNRLLDLG
jgi:hypothetical protein